MEFLSHSTLLPADMARELSEYDDKDRKWIVQEKVKGVPFSLWVSPREVKGANKQRFLREDEEYFNWKQWKRQVAPGMKKILSRSRGHVIVFYGEIFGGYDPDPNFSHYAPGAVPLNRGVAYAPHNDWYVHDVMIDGTWQDQWYIYEMCDTLGLTYAFELFKGSLKKALKFNTDFQTEIPDIYNLSPLEQNTAAGIVIRPEFPMLASPPGKFDEPVQRMIFKKENPKHAGSTNKGATTDSAA